MVRSTQEFSFKSRAEALRRFHSETFDLLIIGGGITGAAAARDAALRGLRVALVDRQDFAAGTSSRSSKLIHGGLRYLQNFELGLVFESLAERAFLLKTVPNMVRPLPFYFPVYRGDRPGKFLLGMGMWLYDLLALFRSPGLHKGLSKKQLLRQIPFLRDEGLKGAYRYFDASMWDDALTVATLRAASEAGAAVANYVEAVGPLWNGERINGYRLRDLEKPAGQGEIDIRAHQVIVCAGPWTDKIGKSLNGSKWRRWLSPSRGVHLVFDLKRLPVPGAVVMPNPEDGRISFVMPRPDFGAGVTIVGTTDGPAPENPDSVVVENSDVEYLMELLNRYFPKLELKVSDILSAYVGIRPLMGATIGEGDGGKGLQKVSREHHIGRGPGGTVVVAGGKYTTHRTMAEEIVDFTLKLRKEAEVESRVPVLASTALAVRGVGTKAPVNPRATSQAVQAAREEARRQGLEVPEELFSRYGAEALQIVMLRQEARPEGFATLPAAPEGFPLLAEQLRYAIRNEMVLHLEDFYLRRTALFLSRKDHGLPWAEGLARVWAEELGYDELRAQAECENLQIEIAKRSAWMANVAAEAPEALVPLPTP